LCGSPPMLWGNKRDPAAFGRGWATVVRVSVAVAAPRGRAKR
jgi:hypothetical protein